MIDPKKVVTVQLITGDAFFAQVDEETADSIVFSDPLTMEAYQVEDGGVGVRFRHWAAYCAVPKVTLKKDHILFCEPAATDIAGLYAQNFNKVYVPNNDLIVP